MNYLAIDVANSALIIAVKAGDKIKVYKDEECGVKHSVKLMTETERLLAECGLNLQDCDFFACVTGAGSFTGIRIGVSTVKALAFACSKPVLNVTSFDTVAYNKNDGKNLAVIDAKHDGYYVCGYEGEKVVLSPRYVDKEQLERLKEEYKLLSFEKISVETEIVPAEKGLVNAIEKKIGEISENAESLEPLYIRKSQAEEGR